MYRIDARLADRFASNSAIFDHSLTTRSFYLLLTYDTITLYVTAAHVAAIG